MIKSYFKTSFTIYRQNWANESSSLQYVAGFKGHLQQASDEEIVNLADIYTLSHKIWCDESVDIQNGDRITDGTYSYTVRSVNRKDFAGRNKHLEVIVEKDLGFISA